MDTDLKRERRLILLVSICNSLLGNVGMSGINVALPAMQRDLGLSAAQVAWVPLSMMLAMAAMSAPGGKVADILGRRRTGLAGTALCILGLALTAMAQNAPMLLAMRVLTGLGLVVVFTNAMAMVTTIYPPEQRGRVLGYTVGSVYVGLSLGPFCCGYLVGWFGWRSIFWLNAVTFLPSFMLLCLVRAEQRPAAGQKFNAANGALWVAAIVALFLGLTHVTQRPYGPILTALGLALAALFAKNSLTAPAPMLETRLFAASRRFAFSSLAAFISYSASMGTNFLLSLYLQYIKGLTPSQAGLVLMVQPVCQAALTPFTGRLSDKVDAGRMASCGMALIAAAIGACALFLDYGTPLPAFIAILLVFGVGFATFSAPNTNAIIGSVPKDRIGQASATVTVTRLCGQVLSIAFTTLVFTVVIGPGEMGPEKYPAFMRAATTCFAIFAPVCLCGIAASLARGKVGKEAQA